MMLPNPYYETELGNLYHGDCLEIMPHLEPVDLVLTDPPYPEQKGIVANFKQTDIHCLNTIKCSQLIFWSAKIEFPLNYNAIHIWDKKVGVQSQYERIFERNTQNNNWRVYNCYFINSSVAASYVGDIFYNHPSQKPKRLILQLLEHIKVKGIVLDPFLGSGTTAVACERLNRRWIGIEIEEKYCAIAKQRIENERKQKRLF